MDRKKKCEEKAKTMNGKTWQRKTFKALFSVIVVGSLHSTLLRCCYSSHYLSSWFDAYLDHLKFSFDTVYRDRSPDVDALSRLIFEYFARAFIEIEF